MRKMWYHGSDKKIDIFNPCSFDLGNTFQQPGWGTFCFKDYDYTKKFAIMRCIQDFYVKIRNNSNRKFLHKNRCTWDFINKKPVTTSEGFRFILNNIDNLKVFIHYIDYQKLKKKGIGNDITHNEFTFRDTNIVPIKIEQINLTYEELKHIFIIVDDVNEYRKKLVLISKYYNRGILSMFMKYDYTMNREEIEKIIVAKESSKLKIGDNLTEYMKENKIAINPTPLKCRIIQAILGSINKHFFTKKYMKRLSSYYKVQESSKN